MLALAIPPAKPGEAFRRPFWKAISPIPMDAVCDAANRLRERVAVRFDENAEVYAGAPFIPKADALAALSESAEAFELQTPSGRVWIVVDRSAAKRLVGLAFGERAIDLQRAWSPIERRTLLSLIRDTAACLTPLIESAQAVQATGDHDRLTHEARHIVSFHINAPVDAELHCVFGFDPRIGSQRHVQPRELLDVKLAMRATAGTIRITCAELATLQIGAILPMDKEGQAQLFVGSTEIARGACGVIGGRLAFRIGESDESRGA